MVVEGEVLGGWREDEEYHDLITKKNLCSKAQSIKDTVV
jgi:hypothetical protein